MNLSLLAENLTNPALLFFILGITAVLIKSDLEIPSNSSRFISLYLLFAIGFKGGQELSHEHMNAEILWSMGFGLLLSALIPLATYFLLRIKLNVFIPFVVFFSCGSNLILNTFLVSSILSFIGEIS